MHCFERYIDMLVVIEKDHLHYYLFYSNQQQAAITSFIFYAFISILLLGLIPQFIEALFHIIVSKIDVWKRA